MIKGILFDKDGTLLASAPHSTTSTPLFLACLRDDYQVPDR